MDGIRSDLYIFLILFGINQILFHITPILKKNNKGVPIVQNVKIGKKLSECQKYSKFWKIITYLVKNKKIKKIAQHSKNYLFINIVTWVSTTQNKP